MSDTLKVFVNSGGKTAGHVFPVNGEAFEITIAYKGIQDPPPPPSLIQDPPPPPAVAPIE